MPIRQFLGDEDNLQRGVVQTRARALEQVHREAEAPAEDDEGGPPRVPLLPGRGGPGSAARGSVRITPSA